MAYFGGIAAAAAHIHADKLPYWRKTKAPSFRLAAASRFNAGLNSSLCFI